MLREILVIQHRSELKHLQSTEMLGRQFVVNGEERCWVPIEGLRIGKVRYTLDVLTTGMDAKLLEVIHRSMVSCNVDITKAFTLII